MIAYFISLIILGNVILINLFLAIIFGNFETDEIDEGLKTKRMSQRIASEAAKLLVISGTHGY